MEILTAVGASGLHTGSKVRRFVDDLVDELRHGTIEVREANIEQTSISRLFYGWC
jgi:hypothetical protein